MISIMKNDVPTYLRSSPHFCNAFQDSVDNSQAFEDTIEVPTDCLKPTPEVQSEADLRALLLTVRYWLVPELTENNSDIFSYALSNTDRFNCISIEFEQDFPFLAKLRCALQPQPKLSMMGSAMRFGLLGFAKYLRASGATWDPGCSTSIVTLAAEGGHLDCLKYAVDNGCRVTHESCCLAAKAGHADCMEFVHRHGGRMNLKVFENAVQSGQLSCVKYIVSSKALDNSDSRQVCDVAARAGNMEALAYLFSVGCEASVHAANAAAALDQIECLKLLYANGCPVSSDTCHVAVHCGSMRCLEYLHEIGCPWNPSTLQVGRSYKIAIACGGQKIAISPYQLESTFLFAAEHGCPITPDSIYVAAELGSVRLVELFHKRGAPLQAAAFKIAVSMEHIDCVQYFLDHHYPVGSADYITAVQGNCLESFKCLYEGDVCWEASVTTAAVSLERLDILRYLLDHGCGVTEEALLVAAKQGNSACLQCLHEHGVALTEAVVNAAIEAAADNCLCYALRQGCSFSDEACVLAGAKGYLQGLKCLHEHGASMTPAVVTAAVEAGKFECVAFAVMHGCEDLGPWACASAAERRSFRPLQHLREQGVQWDATTPVAAIHNNSFECLKYAVRSGCPGDRSTQLLTEAAQYGRIEIMKWLHKKRFPWDARTAAAAVQSDSVECLKYAIERHCPYEVPAEALDEAPRCREYMERRGHKLVRRTRWREQRQAAVVISELSIEA